MFSDAGAMSVFFSRFKTKPSLWLQSRVQGFGHDSLEDKAITRYCIQDMRLWQSGAVSKFEGIFDRIER
jgi:hypothetical protein